MNSLTKKLGCFLLLCFFLIPLSAAAGNPQAISVGPDFKSISMGEGLYVLPDNEGLWHIGDVSSPSFESRFRPNETPSLLLGPPFRKIVWVRFSFRIRSNDPVRPGSLFLELGRARYPVDFYRPLAGGGYERKPVPGKDRNIPGDTGFRRLVFRINPGGPGTITCYARIAVNGPERIPFILRSSDAFRSYMSADNMIFGLLYGILAGMVLYNFFLFITLRHKIYLQYVVYIGFLLSYFLFFMGHLDHLSHLSVKIALTLEYIFLGGAIFCGFVFCRNFFDMGRMAPIWNRLIYLLQAVSCLIVAGGLWGRYDIADFLATFSGAADSAVLLAIGVLQFRQGFRPAGFFILANLFFILGTSVFVFWLMGLLPAAVPADHIIVLGPAAESLLLSFSLAFRIRILEKDKISLAQSREIYRIASQTDGLTGLYNRQYLFDRLEKELRDAGQAQKNVSAIIMDVDNFKKYNDTYGHPEGDVVLKSLAKVIQSSIREMDFGCRYGGEEFAVVLTGAGIDEAFRVAERIRTDFAGKQYRPTDEACVSATVSLGVACCRPDEDAGGLIKRADQALYKSKNSGKNRTEIFVKSPV